jgi:hypothetical protein
MLSQIKKKKKKTLKTVHPHLRLHHTILNAKSNQEEKKKKKKKTLKTVHPHLKKVIHIQVIVSMHKNQNQLILKLYYAYNYLQNKCV